MIEVDRIEILTLQDNYIDLVARDDSEVLTRARSVKGMELKNSILAEHGFCALVSVTRGDRARSLLFDFGFSPQGAALNADALAADLSRVEAVVASHGHLDHVGGLEELVRRVNRTDLPLIVHPAAFRGPRFLKLPGGQRVYFPPFTRDRARKAGLRVIEATDPQPLLDGEVLFLGEIPRRTAFEKGVPYLCYEEAGVERQDPIEDDTAVAVHVRGRGLVVLSGCAHAGIVNTVRHAREVTGVGEVLAVMGGFHLSGADLGSVVDPTAQALAELDPDYVVPTHCTGRDAVFRIEQRMPEKFLLNMAGTKITFACQGPA